MVGPVKLVPYLESNAAATESTDLPPSLFNSLPFAAEEAEGARRMMGVAAPWPPRPPPPLLEEGLLLLRRVVMMKLPPRLECVGQ